MKAMRGVSGKSSENIRGFPIEFESMCPKCKQVQSQRGFDRSSLLRLLKNGYPVEAYCAVCDEFWSITSKERTALVTATIGGGGSFVG